MQLLPLIGFYWRRNRQLTALVESGNSSDKSSHFLLDVATAAVPVLKKYYPALDAEGLFDDALNTLREVLAPDPLPASNDSQIVTGG